MEWEQQSGTELLPGLSTSAPPAASCLWLALNAEWMEAEAADSSYVTHAMHTSVLHGPDMTPPTATW